MSPQEREEIERGFVVSDKLTIHNIPVSWILSCVFFIFTLGGWGSLIEMRLQDGVDDRYRKTEAMQNLKLRDQRIDFLETKLSSIEVGLREISTKLDSLRPEQWVVDRIVSLETEQRRQREQMLELFLDKKVKHGQK